ncbi:PHP domain-containing protein [uncultured Anaerococcus sp.]|uniref:PHP domain-containing protein n=1 Tax=uncultured Anaerococcus sp. TaxID=293428 RepID=UPI00288928E0|nr:PHP domain-containing protein [uncultured Anaerococcus sp.]
MKKIYADLHAHTNHSDGLLEIEEVLTLAKEAGVEVLAITDHDTSNHFGEIKKKADEIGIKTLKALEMSCYDYQVDKKVHIVALFMPEKTPHIDRLCDGFLKRRDDNHKRLIKDLQTKGYDIDYKACKKFSPYSIVFKSNIISALKERYPEKADEITFKSVFGSMKDKKKNIKMGYIDVEEGIKAILADGAIPIIAHPCQYENYPEIEKYLGFGLEGIEISHSKMKEIDYKITKDLAKKYDLLESGGTDFHDPQKLHFGEFGLSKEEFDTLLEKSGRQLDQ